MTTVTPKKNLYNKGQCFTKGKHYTINQDIANTAALMTIELTNDLGERHTIGSWWRDFVIVNADHENDN